MFGTTILQRRQCVTADLIQAYADVPVANISDCMSRLVAAGASLRPMHQQGRLVGPALTVKTRPGDNLFIHKALEMAQPGDVIVVDGAGNLSNALVGELMTSYAQTRGIAGFVIHGAIRDLEVIGTGAFPVYACGVTHRGPYKDGPGAINTPVAIDGMVIEAGDLIVGDLDGLLSIPCAHAANILAAVHAKMEQEAHAMAAIAAGTLDTSWIDTTLRRLGCNPEPA